MNSLRLICKSHAFQRNFSSSSAMKFFTKTSLKAVVGASADRSKFGNKVLRCYVEHEFDVVPVNNKIKEVENIPTVSSLTELHALIENGSFPGVKSMEDVGVSIVTPPAVTSSILEEGIKLGIRYYLLQPGTSDSAVNDFIASRMTNCIVVKSCVLVELGCSTH